MHKWSATLLLLCLVLTTACALQADEDGISTGKGRIFAVEAYATRTAVDIAEKDATANRATRVEATVVAYTTQMSTTLLTAPVEAGARAEAIRAIGNAGAMVIYIFSVALAVATTIFALGRAIAHVRGVILASSYVRINVEPHTMQAPPLIITEDGYLIDTRTGERARLRDSIGVNNLRLATTTHMTEVAQITDAQVRIAKATKDSKAGEILRGIANHIPLLDVTADEDIGEEIVDG